MAGLVQIRNVPDETRRALKSRAAAEGRSLNDYLPNSWSRMPRALRQHLCTEPLVAPTLIDYEVVSALRGITRTGHLPASGAIETLADYDDLSIARWNAFGGFGLRALELSSAMSSYDAAYVVLAEALDATLVTRDRKLAKAAKTMVAVEVF